MHSGTSGGGAEEFPVWTSSGFLIFNPFSAPVPPEKPAAALIGKRRGEVLHRGNQEWVPKDAENEEDILNWTSLLKK